LSIIKGEKLVENPKKEQAYRNYQIERVHKVAIKGKKKLESLCFLLTDIILNSDICFHIFDF
jgi:hypothetical protein